MTIFLNVLGAAEKSDALSGIARRYRAGESLASVFHVDPATFSDIPTSAFAYWTADSLRRAFRQLPRFQAGRRHGCKTNPAGDDTRYLRLWWEPRDGVVGKLEWKPISKGGAFSPYYYDVHLVVAWNPSRSTYLGYLGTTHRPLERPASLDYFFRPGITWPSRTQKFAPRLIPAGTIFTGKGPAAFDQSDDPEHLLAMCALMNSRPFAALLATRLNATDAQARSYEVGTIQLTPYPELDSATQKALADLALEQWKLRQAADQSVETSHAFVLPQPLLVRVQGVVQGEDDGLLRRLQDRIDDIASRVYGIEAKDCIEGPIDLAIERSSERSSDDDDEEELQDDRTQSSDYSGQILSWAVGVAFGRFDWRLATGERGAPARPGPFERLPDESPGMLPGGAAPFHVHPGILVDEPGHLHDLAHLIEEVLTRVDVPQPDNVRRWLQREFFPFHLQRYSKSRRKAPIYWPLSTSSGTYTLWLYYPSLTSQTLYTAVNDFVEPKLKQVDEQVTVLRNKGSGRTRDDEKQLESLQAFNLELIELRDTLLKLAPTYEPSHDDGVQISAAPLWQLFLHRPWQKLLKETWEELSGGKYDWAKLAMSYWADRVLEKCKSDKSLAITHGLENLYVAPEAAPKKTRGRKNAKGEE